MTVYIEKPAVNLREELASLRNQGGYQEQQFYFDNFVTNGTFDTDTTWIKTAFSISGGVATSDGVASTPQLQEVPFPTVKGKVYKVSVTVTTSGVQTLYIRLNSLGNLHTELINTTTKTVTVYLTADGNTASGLQVFFTGGAAGPITVDNISVYETDGTDVIHTMPKGWVPKDVFEDGLLQREGAANDYEVVYDGFDYYVKPTVAPSATTQTCVIGVKA